MSSSSGWWQLKYFLCSPRTLGKDSHFDDHIFQVGWFNHQPVMISPGHYFHDFLDFHGVQ